MADEEVSKNVPSDGHLRKDVAPEAGGELQDAAHPEKADSRFTPGQTNAGQQMLGLASASVHGKDLDAEAETDGTNPV
ncbi:hypothetical protein PV768_21455 [Pseudarthrobacter sp. CC4]|uniref:hypothetical protein n=1 Tax=Pseudarthrobacter sp. CC4 TaxID=3029190 RepID=UPI003B8AA1F6